MATEIEKTFFDTFGIEPITYCSKPILDCGARKSVTCTKDCEYHSGVLYPQITDLHYLKLIKILASAEGLGTVYITNLFDNWIVEGACRSKERFENLESAILHYSCRIAHCLNEKEKHQVRTLFEEG